MGMSAAHCQGNVREFQSVWRVVTIGIVIQTFSRNMAVEVLQCVS